MTHAQSQVEHVFKEFPLRGGSGPLQVLSDIDLGVDDGDLVVLLGPSGCGKSTLLNLVAGFAMPTRGLRAP